MAFGRCTVTCGLRIVGAPLCTIRQSAITILLVIVPSPFGRFMKLISMPFMAVASLTYLWLFATLKAESSM